MKKLFLFVILFTSSFTFLHGQVFYHPIVGVQNSYTGTCMSTTCSATYYDDGGSGGSCTTSDIFGNYSNNINGVLRTFCPSTPGTVVQVSFPVFCIEGGAGCPYEYFQLIDGPTQNGTVLAAGCGTGFQGLTFVSTHPSGCLTFRFWSDDLFNYTGWQANITCVSPPAGYGPGPSSTSNADCSNSTGICSNGYSFSGLSTGPGLTSDGCNGCVTSENFSNWYEFTIATSGTLGFNINPTPTTCDYDYSLYLANTCSGLGSPVRCSYAATTGTTGLGNSAVDNTEDVLGDGYTSLLNVTAGQHYYLLINEWTPNNGSFNFTWTGTATIQTPIPDFAISSTIYNSGSTYNVCQNSPLVLNASGAGGSTFTWWTAATGGTQLASGTSYSPSTASVGSTTYYLQETTSSGCVSARSSITVTVVATPTVNSITSQTLCAGQQTTAVTFTGTATTYSWSNSNTAIGLASSGTGNIPSFTATNSTSSNITGTITVTPTSGSCSGTTRTFTYTIRPTPTVSTPSNQTLCAGQATTAVTFSGTSGATYAWSNNNTATGLGASGNGNIASFTATNSTGSAITSTITVTPTIGTCSGSTANFTITVNPSPTVNSITSQTLCAGQQTT
ncbi:MAG: hypothetical protein EBU01_11835, partial [Crocinitomicaceae bacterium]|nr:hypothetical protein [Crocinitomicaceae bacterium]